MNSHFCFVHDSANPAVSCLGNLLGWGLWSRGESAGREQCYLDSFQQSIIGGSQENGRRAGTENVASIVGLGKASERAAESIEEEENRVRAMRDCFENGVLEAVSGASINGDRMARLPNTSSFSFDGIDSNAALILLDRHGVCCSAGSACKTGSNDGSHVLRAMHAESRARRSLRFSFGRFNSDSEVQRAIEIVPKVVEKLRGSSRPVR